jgi:hypothetical protein
MDDARFPYEGPQELRAMIAHVLEAVIDPEVALNIVDVGLVYGVNVADDIVHVDVTMTSAACPVARRDRRRHRTGPLVVRLGPGATHASWRAAGAVLTAASLLLFAATVFIAALWWKHRKG